MLKWYSVNHDDESEIGNGIS